MSSKQANDVVDSVDTSEVGKVSEPAEQEEVSENAEPQNEQGVQQLQSELATLSDKHLRTLAEYDNYRKRTAREKQSIWDEATADVILRFIPVYDSLSRAVKMEDNDSPHKQGLIKVFQQYQEILKSVGVTEIDALGKPFDPEKHNAVNHIEDENYGENEVSQVFQTGFMRNGKVIRYAVVQVAN